MKKGWVMNIFWWTLHYYREFGEFMYPEKMTHKRLFK